MSATPPVTGTNTYISFADATALADDHLHSAEWHAAVAAHDADIAAAQAEAEALGEPYEAGETVPVMCRRALVTATALLNRFAWAGEPTSLAQSLAWPRRGARDAQGLLLPSDAIPQAIQVACAELAFYLLAFEPHAPRPRSLQTVMIGQSMETYYPSVADELPSRIRLLIAPYLTVSSKHSAEVRI